MATPQPSRTRMPLLWVAGLAIFIAAVFATRFLTRERFQVHVAQVTFQALSSTVSTNGKVEPVAPFQAHAPGPGVVKEVFVNDGEHVVAGARLLRLDDAEVRSRLAAAQATLSAAQLQLADLQHGGSTEERSRFTTDTSTARSEQQAATTNLALVQALQGKGSASASEVGAAQQRLRTADAALSNANGRSTSRYGRADRDNAIARVNDARASVQAAQAALAAVDIRTPISGTVYAAPVAAYDFVPAGEDLMDVADLNRIQVHAYFDEPEVGKLAHGQPVKITWDARPATVWHGHITLAPTTILTYGTRNVGECIITVDDARGDLLPNTNVTVTVTEAQRDSVLSIPREALHTDGTQNYVYRIVAGKLQRTPVQLGSLVSLVSAEIASGVQQNDVVVLGPVSTGKELTDGLVVTAVR